MRINLPPIPSIIYTPEIAEYEEAYEASYQEARAELKEVLWAWQKVKEGLEDTAGQWSLPANRPALYRSQRDLIRSLSPDAREMFESARDVVVDSICFRCAPDGEDGLQIDSWPVLVL